MYFLSTRDKKIRVSGTEAIVKGISGDGGLFVPEFFPKMPLSEIDSMRAMPYYERSAYILAKYLHEFTYDELSDMTAKAYAKFDGKPAPVVGIGDNTYSLELWHGPTHAFKDIALTLLPYLLTESKKKCGITDKTLILVATSGDTGKAALEGFADVDGTKIMVLYPSDGVSAMQKLQMTTQQGGNVGVLGIRGNFDDAQTAAKMIFADKNAAKTMAEKGYSLSSANSINIGRLLPQVAYYFSAYLDLIEAGKIRLGDKVDFCVPSGNFGNILAGFYAKEMGLPVNKLICASNKNNVLTGFFNDGEYDANREFFKTTSPSMDILISSNLERLVFEMSGHDDALNVKRMLSLKEKGRYAVSEKEKRMAQECFFAAFSSEDEVTAAIKDIYTKSGYVCDPHTAVAVSVYNKYKEKSGGKTATIILSTASPVKFAEDVLSALNMEKGSTPFQSLRILNEQTGFRIPESASGLERMPVLHNKVIDKEKIKDEVLSFVK